MSSKSKHRKSSHHLIFTKPVWGEFPLRHYHEAQVRLDKGIHARFHNENEPFVEISKQTQYWLMSVIGGLYVHCSRDVLRVFKQGSQIVLKKYKTRLSKADREALEANIELVDSQMAWLDAFAPGWGAQHRYDKPCRRKVGAKSARPSESAKMTPPPTQR